MRFSDVIDRPIAFNRAFVDLGVGITGALMLSQCVYWSKRTGNSSGGWFYKSQSEWEAETGMTRREQETARKRLVSAGFLEEKRQGVPARLHYRLNIDALDKALSELAESMEDETAQNSQSSLAEKANQECTEQTCSDGGKCQTITETTAETTTEKKTSEPAGRTTDPPPDLTPPTEEQVLRLGNQSQPESEDPYLEDGKRWGTLEDAQLALWMGQQVDAFLEQDAPPRRNIATWANDIRLMRYQDKRELRHIKALFWWAHNDSFWRKNILSPGKLRDKWTELAAQRKEQREAFNATRQSGTGKGGIDYGRVGW